MSDFELEVVFGVLMFVSGLVSGWLLRGDFNQKMGRK